MSCRSCGCRIRAYGHKDELTALQILYNQPYGKQKLTYTMIKELTQALTDPPYYLTTADIWQAYKRLDSAKVRGAPVDTQLTEIVSLVRYLAEKAGHEWLQHLDLQKIDVGKGKRSLVKNGVYVPKYLITVPQDLVKHV